MAAAAAVIGAIAAVAGTVLSARASSRAAAAQQQQRSLEAGRRRRATIRQSRIARGQVVNTAALTGVSGSSAEQGAIGSISSQTGTNLSFLDSFLTAGNKAADARSQANTFGALSKVGATLFSVAGGTSTLAKSFASVRPPAVATSNLLAGASN